MPTAGLLVTTLHNLVPASCMFSPEGSAFIVLTSEVCLFDPEANGASFDWARSPVPPKFIARSPYQLELHRGNSIPDLWRE